MSAQATRCVHELTVLSQEEGFTSTTFAVALAVNLIVTLPMKTRTFLGTLWSEQFRISAFFTNGAGKVLLTLTHTSSIDAIVTLPSTSACYYVTSGTRVAVRAVEIWAAPPDHFSTFTGLRTSVLFLVSEKYLCLNIVFE